MDSFHDAARQGDADAQFFLGQAYQLGEGVSQDNVRAYMWFHISESNVEPSEFYEKLVKDKLEILEGKMSPSKVTKTQQLAKECVAKNYAGC